MLFGANHDIQRTRVDCSRISSRRPAGATAWARRDQLRARTQARAHFFVLCLHIGISQQFCVGDHFAKNQIAIRCVCVSLTWTNIRCVNLPAMSCGVQLRKIRRRLGLLHQQLELASNSDATANVKRSHWETVNRCTARSGISFLFATVSSLSAKQSLSRHWWRGRYRVWVEPRNHSEGSLMSATTQKARIWI